MSQISLISLLRSLSCFTWVSWKSLPSTNVSYRPQFRCFFLLSFVAIYSLNETCVFHFSLLRSYFFSLFLFLCSTFPVFYFLSFSSVFLCISSNFSSSFCLFLCMSSTFFPAAFYLSLFSLFVYHLIFLSGSISFFGRIKTSFA